jgi:hypothetical protein
LKSWTSNFDPIVVLEGASLNWINILDIKQLTI